LPALRRRADRGVDRAQQTERLLPVPYFLVTFTDTDSATQERRECTLDAEEFRRRYLQHVLPPGQHRVRYFGWMHPSAKRRRLIVEILLAVPLVVRPKVEAPEPWHLRCPPCRTPSRTSPLKIQFPSSEPPEVAIRTVPAGVVDCGLTVEDPWLRFAG
jgi:hypothetical protein